MFNKEKIEQFFIKDAGGINAVVVLVASHFNIMWLLCLSIPIVIIYIVMSFYYLIKNKVYKLRLTAFITNIVMAIIMLAIVFFKLL